MTLSKDLPTYSAFQKIGVGHHHGINLPLFSLRSNKGYGVGEFLDLIPLIDWVRSLGFSLIQLLPLNDSGFESSPYNAFSSCALNPLFLSLWDLPYLEKDTRLLTDLQTLIKYRPLQRFPYHAVLGAKLRFLKKYFDVIFSKIADLPEYQTFAAKHHWLKPYALFKVLKHEHAHQDWIYWHPSLRNPSPPLLRTLYKEKAASMNFWFMVQFFCFDQMKRVRRHGHQQGVFLKGDIPILISPEALDVWAYRKDFNLDYSAGSPPDMFTEEGQYWGFPLFRWDVIEQDGFTWWKERLQTASELYDLYRIDHIIGFFRIWAIQRGKRAIEGEYRPKQSWAALEQGRRILKYLISFTDMLPIGEDLGVEVETIREVMIEMGICGTRIPRWERKYHPDGPFIPFDQYPTLSLTTASTHDSETLELWWKGYPTEVQEFCEFSHLSYQPQLTPDIRYELLKQTHTTSSLFHINLLNEYLALFPTLVWKNPQDERINTPGIIHPCNWSYRFRPTIEEILEHKDLAETIKSMKNP